jgi:hypothetical protein
MVCSRVLCRYHHGVHHCITLVSWCADMYVLCRYRSWYAVTYFAGIMMWSEVLCRFRGVQKCIMQISWCAALCSKGLVCSVYGIIQFSQCVVVYSAGILVSITYCAGIMVCSTDILLAGSLVAPDVACLGGDILLYTVAAPLDYATGHGVAVSRESNRALENILYQPSIDELRYPKSLNMSIIKRWSSSLVHFYFSNHCTEQMFRDSSRFW